MNPWTPADLANALRIVIAKVSMANDGYQATQVLVQNSDVEVSFRLRDDPTVYLVRLATRAPLYGVSTGEPCSSPEEWATEVWMLLDEVVGTREIHSARRTVDDDGVVTLHL